MYARDPCNPGRDEGWGYDLMETDDNVKILVQLQKDMLAELRIQSLILKGIRDQNLPIKKRVKQS